MKAMEYKDKVVIVTGGAQGIGKCIIHVLSNSNSKPLPIFNRSNQELYKFKKTGIMDLVIAIITRANGA